MFRIKMKNFLCSSIVLLLGLCSCQASSNTNTNEATSPPTNTDGSTIELYTELSESAVIDSINNYYIDYYRNMTIYDSEEHLNEGKTLNYSVYYAGDNYLLVKFDDYTDDELYYNATFLINEDLTITMENILDYDKLDAMYTADNVELCEGDFYVQTLSEMSFDNYDGKEELLDELSYLIWYRYFYTGDDKAAYDKCVFSESTTATKVELVDFDDKNSFYRLFAYTATGYVYDVTVEYNEEDQCYEFCEWPQANYLVSDLTATERSNDDESLVDFISYYNVTRSYIINTIKSDSYSDVRN